MPYPRVIPHSDGAGVIDVVGAAARVSARLAIPARSGLLIRAELRRVAAAGPHQFAKARPAASGDAKSWRFAPGYVGEIARIRVELAAARFATAPLTR